MQEEGCHFSFLAYFVVGETVVARGVDKGDATANKAK